MKYGYLRKNMQNGVDVEAIQKLCSVGCDQIVVEDKQNGTNTTEELDATLKKLEPGDSITIIDLAQLGKTITSLGSLMEIMDQKKATLEVLSGEFSMEEFLPVIRILDNMERSVRRDLTMKGLEKAKELGRKGGRPHISEETAERIKQMFAEDKYSLREIAERCSVSLGTVYKYSHLKSN